jgi:hypothetical protein
VDQNVALERRRAALAGTVAGTGGVFFFAWRRAVRIDEAGFVVVLPKR